MAYQNSAYQGQGDPTLAYQSITFEENVNFTITVNVIGGNAMTFVEAVNENITVSTETDPLELLKFPLTVILPGAVTELRTTVQIYSPQSFTLVMR